MALADFVAQLDALASEAQAAFAAATDTDALEAARVDFLGAKAGRFKAAQKGMGQVEKTDKPAAGKKLNDTKSAIESALATATERLATASSGAQRESFDITLPGRRPRIGKLHPITQTIERMKDIMGRLGFTAVEGPEIEDDWHNFEALNISLSHPARDPLDNFYLHIANYLAPGESPGAENAGESPGAENAGESPGAENAGESPGAENAGESPGAESAGESPGAGARSAPDDSPGAKNGNVSPGAKSGSNKPLLLRSQTSTVQIRVMESTPPPVRIVSLGRVYRPDTADATHYPMFHQIEGLLIDERVTMADLKSVLRMFCQAFYDAEGTRGDDEAVHIRFRPSFFPFTEPSVEVDINWQGGWMEIGGAGMVDPNVLRAVGYDPDQVTGFAFGMGVERIAMRQHHITDIRDLYTNDVRFLAQF